MTEKDSAEYYGDPKNRRIVGPAQRRKTGAQLGNHVAIRFSSVTMAVVRTLAYRDGVTVSSWVRAVVEREVERRLPSARTGASYEVHQSLPASNTLPVTSTNLGAPAVPPSLVLVAS
ncbi:MAG TPA: hypothetical protein VIO57_11190 [Chloroflexota bacterium]